MGSRERAERERAERRRQREELILSAAERLFLEKGFIATTINDIAAECELTNAAIYLYYRNKDELVLRVMTGISRKFGRLLEDAENGQPDSDGFSVLKNILNVYNYTFSEYRHYHVLDAEFNMMFCRQYPESAELEEYFTANSRVLEIMSTAILAGFKDGSIQSAMSAERLAGMLLNALNSYIEKISLRKDLMEREQKISLEDELNEYINYLVEALKA